MASASASVSDLAMAFSQVNIWKIPPNPPKIATKCFSTDSTVLVRDAVATK